MSMRANPGLVDDLQRYGAQDVSKCYHCGNCTAACRLSQEPTLIPRRSMRALQMGLKQRLRSSLDPWLCYYCGDCSEQCPRGANPGETMMSMRRWLTAQYDFTGIARLFYRFPQAQVLAMLAVSLLTGVGFVIYALMRGASLSVFDGSNAFLPESAVHVFDWIIGGGLIALLLINCARMWYLTMLGEGSVPVSIGQYLKQALLLPIHFLTQKRYRDCKGNGPWAIHIVIMLSYVTMLVLIIFFLGEMQHGPELRWKAHAFGYLATIGLLVALTLALRGRLSKSSPHNSYSHATDWVFLGMLLFLAVSGIVLHVLHRTGLPAAANVLYLVHLSAAASFEVCQVPFSKWSHMAYRPLAMYFAKRQQVTQATDVAARPVESPVTTLGGS
jgi:ferredoxin